MWTTIQCTVWCKKSTLFTPSGNLSERYLAFPANPSYNQTNNTARDEGGVSHVSIQGRR